MSLRAIPDINNSVAKICYATAALFVELVSMSSGVRRWAEL